MTGTLKPEIRSRKPAPGPERGPEKFRFLFSAFLISVFCLLAFAPAAQAVGCSSPVGSAGHIINSAAYNGLQYCDGTNWIAMGPKGAGGAGCSNPAGTEGHMIYNSDYNVMQYCDGTKWNGMGPSGASGSGSANPIGGPIGWWRFDEGSGTTTADFSGNGLTGTFNHSPTWTTSGEINDALSFVHATPQNYVGVPNNSILSGMSTLTVAFWVKVSAGSPGQYAFILKRNSTSSPAYNSYWIQANLTNLRYEPTVCNSSGTCSAFTSSTNGTLVTGVWQHVAMVYDGANVWTYVNGSLSGGGGALTGSVMTSDSELAIGDDPYGSGFTGGLDDVRIYNRNLSAAEISDLYTNALVGWWKMDEGSGTTTADSSGNGNTGTLTNSPTWTTSGEINDALSFNGTTQLVNVPDVASLQIPGSWTVATWVNLNSPRATSRDTMIVKSTTSMYANYNLFLDNGSVTAGLGWAIAYTSGCGVTMTKLTTTPSTGVWYHVAGVYNSVAQTLTLYVNGSNVASNSVTGCLPSQTGPGNTLTLGIEYSTAATALNGILDDSRVYNRALSAAEVSALYSGSANGATGGVCGVTGGGNGPTTGLVGWWKLDDGSSGTTPTTAADSSGTGNAGTLTNSPTWTTSGVISNALTFGTNMYVNIPDAASLDLAASWTVSAWVNPSSFPVSGDWYALLNRSGGAGKSNYELDIENNGGLVQWNVDFDSAGSSYLLYTSNIVKGSWYHLAGVWDSSSNNLYLYLDGVLVGTQNTGTYTPLAASGYPLTIGGYVASHSLIGSIDDARVYNRALSATEIAALFHAGAASAGTMFYNGDHAVMEYCNGTNWVRIGK